MTDKYVLEVAISGALKELRLAHPSGATEDDCRSIIQQVLYLDPVLFSMIARLTKRVEYLEKEALDKFKQSS